MSFPSSAPFNCRYFIQLAAEAGGRILDYGCGSGETVALGRSAGPDIWGADTFAGYHARWGEALNPTASGRVVVIENQHADFPDAHIDIVLSNQVLEHVSDPERLIADVLRLLRPGGLFVAAFPVVETWYEGPRRALFRASPARRGINKAGLLRPLPSPGLWPLQGRPEARAMDRDERRQAG
jgi:SAM-dependent methyltransferase